MALSSGSTTRSTHPDDVVLRWMLTKHTHAAVVVTLMGALLATATFPCDHRRTRPGRPLDSIQIATPAKMTDVAVLVVVTYYPSFTCQAYGLRPDRPPTLHGPLNASRQITTPM